MIDQILHRFAGARSSRDLLYAQIDAENLLTPLEFMRLAEHADTLPENARPWLRATMARISGGASRIRPYGREVIGEGILRFSAPPIRPSQKKLIITFAGFKGRAMMPTAIMLQMLPEDLCDFVVLHDGSRNHFLKGLWPHADSFFGLVEFLRRVLQPQTYEKTYCYGASGGGFAALRCAILMKAHRGIAASGRLYWHVNRLREGSEGFDPAFDPICHCFADSEVEMICAYGADNEEDRADAARVANIVKARLMPFDGIREHNFVWELTTANKARSFLAEIFDLPLAATPVDQIMATLALSTQTGGFMRSGAVADGSSKRPAARKLRSPPRR